jgi:hypothetical protein
MAAAGVRLAVDRPSVRLRVPPLRPPNRAAPGAARVAGALPPGHAHLPVVAGHTGAGGGAQIDAGVNIHEGEAWGCLLHLVVCQGPGGDGFRPLANPWARQAPGAAPSRAHAHRQRGLEAQRKRRALESPARPARPPRQGLSIDPDHLTCAAGAGAIVDLLFHCIASPEDGRPGTHCGFGGVFVIGRFALCVLDGLRACACAYPCACGREGGVCGTTDQGCRGVEGARQPLPQAAIKDLPQT